MNSAIERLIEMSYGQAFIMGIIFAAIYFLVGYDSGQLHLTKAKNAQKRVAEISQEIATTQVELTRSREFKETLKLKDEQFLTFTSYIPEQLSISDMMKSISAEAKAAGVNILSIKESSAVSNTYEYTDPLAIEIDLEGGFPQHILFLSYLTRLDSIFTVASMSFLNSAGENKDPSSISVKFSGVIVGYRYVSRHVDDKGGR